MPIKSMINRPYQCEEFQNLVINASKGWQKRAKNNSGKTTVQNTMNRVFITSLGEHMRSRSWFTAAAFSSCL